MAMIEELRLRAALGSLVFAIEGSGYRDLNGSSAEGATAFREARKLLDELGVERKDVTLSREDFFWLQGIDPKNFEGPVRCNSKLTRFEKTVLCAVSMHLKPFNADDQLANLLARGLVAQTKHGWVVTEEGSRIVNQL